MQALSRRRIPLVGRTPLIVALLVGAVVAFPSATASATGPGGWEHLGSGGSLATLSGPPHVLYPRDATHLIVGGAFLNAGGHAAADNLAIWTGSTWTAVPGAAALNGSVQAIAYDGSKLIVGGQFTDAGGNGSADYVARLGSSGWETVCTGDPLNGSVSSLQIIGSTLYIGGSFQDGAGIAAADYLLACNLTNGAPSATVSAIHSFSGPVFALTADANANPNLYAAGGFSNLDSTPAADNVAYLDTGAGGAPGTWHAMGSGPGTSGGAVDGFVRSITAHGNNVYVGSDALDIGGIAKADHVARWNGTAWSAMGSNTAHTNGWFPTTSFEYGMTTAGPNVFVTGSFQNADGDARADMVAFFDGNAWHPIGSDGNGNGPLNALGLTVALFQGDLYDGGNFTAAGGDTKAQHLAKFSLVRPDARIGLHSSGPFSGGGVYTSSGAGESKTQSVHRGHAGTFFVDVQNDGLTDHAFKVDGNGSARGYTVKYFHGTTNVTTSVRGGSYTTRTLAPGAHTTLKMVVSLAGSTANGASFVTIAKGGAGNPVDAVLAKVKVA